MVRNPRRRLTYPRHKNNNMLTRVLLTGPDNWDEYIYLLESLWLQKATAHEFEQSTKSLFRIEYDTIRKKMNSMVVKKMITPRLEEIQSSLPQRSEECRGS